MILTTVALTALLSFSSLVASSPCVVFDADFNLLLLGAGGKDYNIGQQSSWSSPNANDITATGRPPFDGTTTTCYLSQFENAIYVMNGDNSNPSDVAIYDATAKSWTTQKLNTNSTGGSDSFNPSSFTTILDHDTNVFYALSGGKLFFADFAQEKAAKSDPISWTEVGTPSTFDASSYKPVMALAQNHIHFLNTPNAQPGTAEIFVIHFSFFQPEAQSYPINGGGNFPESDGAAFSLWQPLPGVQQEFVFVPSDSSKTYVINVETNTTQALAGPSDTSSGATYTAGETSIVQLTSAGNVFFLPYNQNDTSANAAASWTKIALSGVSASSGGTSSSTTASGGASSTKSGTGTQTGSASGSTQTTGTSGAERVTPILALSVAAVVVGLMISV